MCEYDTHYYGADKCQFIRLYNYKTSLASSPIHLPKKRALIVVIHGGYFKQQYTVDNSLIDTIPTALAKQGFAVCTIEYRRVGDSDGGWPNTNKDVIDGLNVMFHHVSNGDDVTVDVTSIVIVGHSAGGTLALWCCSNHESAQLSFAPRLCVGLAPIGDLEEGQRRKLSDEGDAIDRYIRGCSTDGKLELVVDEEMIKRYQAASPHYHLPTVCSLLLVVGNLDDCVPVDLVTSFYDHSYAFYSSNRSDGNTIELLLFNDGNHFTVVDTSHSNFTDIIDAIKKHL